MIRSEPGHTREREPAPKPNSPRGSFGQSFMKRIVAGIDESDRSLAAVQSSSRLADALHSRLEFVQAIDVQRPNESNIDVAHVAATNAQTLSNAWTDCVQWLKTELGNDHSLFIESMVHVASGSPAQVLCRHAQESRASLLVLGDCIRRGEFGSTWRACLAKAPCPLWFQKGPARPIRNILAPIDFSEDSIVTLILAMRLADAMGASLTALHCLAESENRIGERDTGFATELETALARRLGSTSDLLPNRRGRFEARLVEGEPRSTLLTAAPEADLVVMCTHGGTGLAREVPGGVSLSMVKHSRVPTLVVPSKRSDWLLE